LRLASRPMGTGTVNGRGRFGFLPRRRSSGCHSRRDRLQPDPAVRDTAAT
jgi:hypothetical protein